MQTLEDLLKETDALTYINSLKVTLQELKNEFSTIEEMRDYMAQATERARKLIRKADNQYRLITKLVQREAPFASDVSVANEIEEVMMNE